MGMMDTVKGWLGGNKGQAKGGVDKGADLADGETGGKYGDHIDTGSDKAKEQIDKLPDS